MPVRPGDKLRKVTLNLYETDCAFLAEHLGQGWSVEVREAVHAYAQRLRCPAARTLGDLADE